MSWRRLRSLLAPLLALMLLITSIVPVAAEPLRPSSSEAISLLTAYGMVLGDENGNLHLTKKITRAEAATIFVRAVGQESAAKLLGNLSSFPDTNGHWSAPYVTVAFRLGLIRGRDTGMFDPEAEITNAEVLTVLLRIVKREPTGVWIPANIMAIADELGLVNFPNAAAVANQQAIRGEIFQSLAWTLTTVPIADEGGKTALAAYVDKIAPKLTVEAVPASTGGASVRLTGTAKGADYVLVNGKKVSLAGEAFTTDVALSFGNNAIEVEAYDWAGNKDSKSFTVARAGEAARIVVEGEVAVKAGESAKVNVKAYDAQGTEIPTSLLKAAVSNSLGTFDPATATFKAGTAIGKGAITFTSGSATATVNLQVMGLATEAYSLSITSGTLVTQGKSTEVTVKVLDRNGQPVTWDSGRAIKLTSSNQNALWVTSGETALTDKGVATFTVGGLQEGLVSVTATSSGLTTTSTGIQVASSTRIVLVPSVASAAADGVTPISIRAALQDEEGRPVNNTTGSDIVIDLSSSGGVQANLTGRTVTIGNGANISSSVGSLVPGFENESVSVSGTVRSGRAYTVISTRVSFVKREIGTPSRLELTGGGNLAPNTPTSLTLTVRDAQGNVIPTGSFAFQLQVTTNNPETTYAGCAVVSGMPPCVNVQLGTTGRNPVAAANGAVIGRTVAGYATINLNYTRSGNVTVKVLPASGTGGGWDSQGAGTFGNALSSTGLSMGERTISYAGSPHHVSATIDLPSLGLTDQSHGILAANGGTQGRIRVQVMDNLNGKIGSAVGTATLEKLSGTATTPLSLNGIVTNGTVEFPIQSTTNVGTDEYKVTYYPNPSTPLTTTIKVTTTNAVLATRPFIVAISGQSGNVNRVTSSDSYMEIQLPNYGPGIYGYVKVYRNSGGAVFTSPVIELNGGPYVRVPRANLAQGSDSYYVVINNGFGDTAVSDRYPAPPSTVAVENLVAMNVTQVRYNAYMNPATTPPTLPTLTVYANGLQTGGTIDLNKLTLSYSLAAGGTGTIAWGSPTCTVGNGYFTCTNVTIPAIAGTISLVTADGWYRHDQSGTVAQADTVVTDNVLYGIGSITHGIVSFGTDSAGHVTGRITLYGANLNQGAILPQFLKVSGIELGLTNQSFTAGSGNAITFDLPNFNQTPYPQDENNSVAHKLQQLVGPGITMQADLGWFRNSSEHGPAIAATIPLYKAVNITGVQYVGGATPKLLINGSGLAGTVQPQNLRVTDRSDNEVLPLTDAGNTVDPSSSDTQIIINLTTAQATLLEDPASNYRYNLFLSSKTPNATDFWLMTGGWYAAGLGQRLYLVSW